MTLRIVWRSYDLGSAPKVASEGMSASLCAAPHDATQCVPSHGPEAGGGPGGAAGAQAVDRHHDEDQQTDEVTPHAPRAARPVRPHEPMTPT